MKFKKLESGRSMVEMLGVLAIIGVLSVGGIAGYSLSMRRHRANAVADAVSKYALITYNACQQKIMNGEVGTSSSNAGGCNSWQLTPSEYADSDLGPLPAGVSDIVHGYISFGSTGQDDTVITRVIFTDQKLCQAFTSITATAEKSVCNNNDYYKHVSVRTKQN